MKIAFFFYVCTLFIPVDCSAAEQAFSGPICQRGKFDMDNFKSSSFDIEKTDGKFVTVCDQGKRNFPFETIYKILEDAVISKNHKAVALSLRKSDKWGDSRVSLATVDESGQSRVYEYKEQNLTKNLGWIVELGAVSDNGKLILAKCATFLPEENGVQVVNHHWAILSIDSGLLEVLEIGELESLISKWSEYTTTKPVSVPPGVPSLSNDKGTVPAEH